MLDSGLDFLGLSSLIEDKNEDVHQKSSSNIWNRDMIEVIPHFPRARTPNLDNRL